MRWRAGRSAAERQHHHTRHRPRDEWIAVDVPPIVSRGSFARVQARRPLRQAESRRNNTRRDYLLRAQVSCAVCGLAASGRPRGAHAYISAVAICRASTAGVRSIAVSALSGWIGSI